jgi:hypothetical protein
MNDRALMARDRARMQERWSVHIQRAHSRRREPPNVAVRAVKAVSRFMSLEHRQRMLRALLAVLPRVLPADADEALWELLRGARR